MELLSSSCNRSLNVTRSAATVCARALLCIALTLLAAGRLHAQDAGPVQFAATDSLIIRFDGDQAQAGELYGSSRIESGEATLQAYRVDLFFERDEASARGLPSDTGLVGRPFFEDASESFFGDELTYNLQTRRGRVVRARSRMDEGFVQGGVVKVTEDSTVYVADGLYTTCDCETDPSYSLRSSKMKIVDQEQVYTGPIQLFLFNIPTPLWLPFGILPATAGRRSGPLPPEYGESRELGFYLRNFGYYWAISDYLDLEVRAGIWTSGSWSLSPRVRYKRRYAYEGDLRGTVGVQRRGESNDPDFQRSLETQLRWTHNQEFTPTSALRSDVNIASTTQLRYNTDRRDDRVRSTLQSSVNYSKRWAASNSRLQLKATHSQQLATGRTNITLPTLSFTKGSFQPLARERRAPGEEERWYEKITLSYNGSGNLRYDFSPRSDAELESALPDSAAAARARSTAWYDALFDPARYELATGDQLPIRLDASHSVPVRASFNVTRLPLTRIPANVSVTPSFTYRENWYGSVRRDTSDADSTLSTVRERQFFALRQYDARIDANTTIYGTFPLRVGPLRGLRHVLRPSVGFTYAPDFYSDRWGYTETYLNREGERERYGLVPGVPSTERRSLSFALENVFQSKLVREDTSGTNRDRAIDLLRLNLQSAYNFAAVERPLAPISASARTRIGDRLTVRSNARFSPYALAGEDESGLYSTRYVWEDGPALPYLTNLSLSASTSFQAERTGRPQPAQTPRVQPSAPDYRFAGDADLPPTNVFGRGDFNTPIGYADFSIPWALDVDLNYRLRRTREGLEPQSSLDLRFDFSLTPNWKVQGATGYDLRTGEIGTTDLTLLRNFECWEMQINWTPIGRFQSFGFDLHVKSGKLRDLLRIQQPRSEARGRFGI